MSDREWLDDGYPTDAALVRVQKWKIAKSPDDIVAALAFVGSLWSYPDRWRECDGVYTVNTGGWSGNESLVAAMRDNFVLWSLTWVASVRGGHYTFAIGQEACDRAFYAALEIPLP